MTAPSSLKAGPRRIYVAGPYTAATLEEIEENVERAIDAGIALIRKRHFPFIPHLSHYVEMRAMKTAIIGDAEGGAIPYETWLRQDRVWLEFCDGLLLLAHSPGADRELEVAGSLGLPIWTDVKSVPSAELEGNRGL